MMKNPAFNFLVFSLFVVIFTTSAYAAERIREPPNFRSSAMGGTGISSEIDTNSMHYNPATMANVFESLVDILALQVDYDKGGEELYDKLKVSPDITTLRVSKVKIDELLDIIQNNDNRLEVGVHAKTSYIFSYKRPGFRVGITAGQYLRAGFHVLGLTRKYTLFELANAVANPDSPFRTELASAKIIGGFRKDLYGKIGMSIPLWRGIVVLGVSYAYIERTELAFDKSIKALLDSSTDREEIASFSSDKGKSNRYVDLGMLIRIPGSLRARLGIAYKNATNETSDEVKADKQELAVGVSAVPVFGKSFFGGVRLTLAADYRDVLKKQDTSNDNEDIKNLHAGVELGFFPYDMGYTMLALRAGTNQGYLTYGFETNFGLQRTIIIGFSKYGEELGDNNNAIESRRTAWYASVGFSF